MKVDIYTLNISIITTHELQGRVSYILQAKKVQSLEHSFLTKGP